jgi:glutamine amidotransferase
MLNGDGFGIGFYPMQASANGKEWHRSLLPGIVRQVTPAWNSATLRSLSSVIQSELMFAHVRKASDPLSIAEQNCHPFQFGRWMVCAILLFSHYSV